MTQGNLGTWKKKIGDTIEPGDVLVEIETDKAQMDFECQDEGFLAKLMVNEGTKDVPVNQVKQGVINVFVFYCCQRGEKEGDEGGEGGLKRES